MTPATASRINHMSPMMPADTCAKITKYSQGSASTAAMGILR